MNIFGGRPGIAAGVLAVVAILAAAFCIIQINIALLLICISFVIICIVLFTRKYISSYRLFVNILLTVVFSVSLIRGLSVFYREIPTARSLCGENMYVHATVTERRHSSEYFTEYAVRLHSVNGIEYCEKAILNCEYSSNLQKGYEFVLRNAKIIYVDDLDEDEAMSLVSEEIYLSVTSAEECDCAILSENNLSFEDRLSGWNSYLSAKIRNNIKGVEGRLIAAMLLGDKSNLTSETYRDFSRAGMSHYLAVSGLHVSIITGIVSFILLRLRIKRSLRNFLISIFSLGYLCILGFPVSAVRSVIMLTTVFLAYSIGDVSDSLNALGIAAVLIILINPASVFDKSFILSFCATLGIVSFMPLFNEFMKNVFEKKGTKQRTENKKATLLIIMKKSLAFVLVAFMSVSSALSLTLLPVSYMFGEMSVCGFGSNLCAAMVATPMLAASLLYLFVGGVPYLGDMLEFVIKNIARVMLDIADHFSEKRNALVSLESNEVKVAVSIFTIIIIVLLVIKVKPKKLLLLIPSSYPLILGAMILISFSALPNNTDITVTSMFGDEIVVAQCKFEAALVDITDGTYTALQTSLVQAESKGVTEFEKLILTHYHTRHISTVSRFIATKKVRLVLLPYPNTEDDAWIMAQLVDVIQSTGTACKIYLPNEDTELIKGTKFMVSEITEIERSSHPIMYLSISDNNERLTYLSASAWEGEESFIDGMETLAENSDILLFGAHGPVAKSNCNFRVNLESVQKYIVFDKSHLEYLLYNEEPLIDIYNPKYKVYIGPGVFNIEFENENS